MKKNKNLQKTTKVVKNIQIMVLIICIGFYLVILLTHVHEMSVLVFWFILFSTSLIGCYRLWRECFKDGVNFLSHSILSSTSPQLLYECFLPRSVYRINQLKFSGFGIESVLFNHSDIYIMESFNGRGLLNGEEDQYLLEIVDLSDDNSIKRKVRNPIVAIQNKYQVFKSLCQIYHLNVTVKSAIYFKKVELNLSLSNIEHVHYLCGEAELKSFITSLEKLNVEGSKSRLTLPHRLYEVLYFLESIRYFDYLGQFYDQLSVLQKVNLKYQLSEPSQILFSFIISRDGTLPQRIERFIGQNETLLERGIELLQVKLFAELEEWACPQEDVVFLPFNFKALVLSEGFNLKQQMDNWEYHHATMN